jgi:hypothetical protein
MSQILPIDKSRFKSNGCASRTKRTVIKATQTSKILPTIPVDLAMEKRLLVDDTKIDGMILSYNNWPVKKIL